MFLKMYPETLADKWSLVDHGMEGHFGYLFHHEMGELLLFQSKESDSDADVAIMTGISLGCVFPGLHGEETII